MARRGIDFRTTTSTNTGGIQQASRAFRLQAKAMKRAADAARVLSTNTARIGKIQRTINSSTAKGAATENKATRATQRRIRALERQIRTLKKQNRIQKKANRLNSASLNIMQRIVTAMVIFGGTHQLIRGFQGLVKAGMDFNRTMESAKLGIAALITASGSVVDSQGAMVDITEKFAFAQGEARRQVQLLRKDALATEATFQELMDIFQLGIAPGLTAGMELDDIRKFSIRISQAATALQMPQRQLSEEIRSILQGTIRLTSTRIAAALNITNQQISKWRNLGTLGEELFKRFEAFGEASKELRNTWAGLTGRISDAFQQLAGTASEELFKTLKENLKGTFDLMVKINDEGIEINPDLVEAAKLFFDALKDIVLYAKEASSAFALEDVKQSMSSLSNLVRIVGKRVVDVIFGLKEGASILSNLVRLVGRSAASLGLTDTTLGSILRKLVEVSTVWAGLVVSAKLSQTAVIGMTSAIGLFRKGLRLSQKAFNTMLSPVGIIVAGILGLAKILNEAVSKDLGVSADLVTQMGVGFRILGDIVERVVSTLKLGFEAAFRSAEVAIAGIKVGYQGLVKAVLLGQRAFLKAKYAFLGGDETAESLGRVDAAIKKVDQSITDAEKSLSDTSAKSLNKIREQLAETTRSWKTLGADIGNTINEYWEDFEKNGRSAGKVLKEDLKNLLGSGLEAGENLFNRLKKDITEASKKDPIDVHVKPKLDPFSVDRPALNLENVPEVLEPSRYAKVVAAIGKAERVATSFAKAEEAITKTLKSRMDDLVALSRQKALAGRPEEAEEKIKALDAQIDKQKELLNVEIKAGRRRQALQEEITVLQARLMGEEIDAPGQEDRMKDLSAKIAELRSLEGRGRGEEIKEQRQILEGLQQKRGLLEGNLSMSQAIEESYEKRSKAVEDLQEKLRMLKEAKAVEVFLAKEAARQAQEQYRLLKLQAEGGVWNSLEAGLLQFAYNTKTTFEGIRDVVTSAMNQLASVVSQTLVDAFDPTKDVDLKERFARFLQSIAKMAIETFLKIAMAKAVAFAFGGGGGGIGGTVGGAVSRARGGMIPSRAQASLAHYMAPQGLARGGRPAGLHPTDTVPIWAAPGEFMMKVDAVRRYGADVMAKINAGLVDPAGLRGLASSVRASRRRSSGPGFAAGGKVPQDQQVPVQSGGVNRSILVANDETADMLLNGGRAAVLRFLAENKDDVNGALA